MRYMVSVGGSPQARKRWPTREYRHRRSARRRQRQIAQARDIGVVTVWIVPV